MIFIENLEKQLPFVKQGVSELFEAAFDNQTHPQDLLLVDQHGFYQPKFEGVKSKFSPYLIGLDFIGFAERTDYEFIDWYRKSHMINNKEDFLKNIQSDDKVVKIEIIAIQIEKSIYLKFWESDFNLKKLYQLSLLARGLSYDWHFEIPTNLRAGSKHEIIREKIRDKIKDICPRFFELLRKNYKTQIRNAIAHSQFSIIGRSIDYLNYSDDPNAHCPIRSLNFDQWYELFHDTLLLHSELIKHFNTYRDKYRQKAMRKNNCLEVRITKKDGTIELNSVGLVKDRNIWVCHNNLPDKDKTFT